MGNINVLDFHIANLIAAGEVVDRPGSVVKELLENAIDAGGTHITVEIKRGGVSFIRVTDDGCGMAREDVPISLKRHATSKIRAASDLDSIATLGFRGEALAAISAVSKIRIMTKRPEDEHGTLLEAHGGKVMSIADTGCPDGTTILVENLFYNTPARLKFLKKDGTEAGNVAAFVEKIALSHPDIVIRFISDGELKYVTNGDGKPSSVVYAVLGREFARKMLELDGGFDGVKVTGYIGTPENVRGNRNLQIFFINNRFIRSKTVSAALEQAFATFIPGDKFPCAVLYLTMNPGMVDVNVHPAKLEVKFSNERLIFESVYYAVRGVLETGLSRPELSLLEKQARERAPRETANGLAPVAEGRGGEKTVRVSEMRQTLIEGMGGIQPDKPDSRISGQGVPLKPSPVREAERPVLTKPETEEKKPAAAPANGTEPADTADIPLPKDGDAPVMQYAFSIPPLPKAEKNMKMADKGGDAGNDIPRKTEREVPAKPDNTGEKRPPSLQKAAPPETAESSPAPVYRMVGEVFQCYVIVEADDTMYLIDKHAAHERILFEEFKKNARAAEALSQILLLPLSVTLSHEEAAAAADFEKEISAVGYSYRLNGRTAELYAVPAFLDAGAAQDAFCETASQLAENTGSASLNREILFERALFQASCKAAVKAGRNYDPEHLRWICDRVMTDPAVRYCPHGRPVCCEVSKASLQNRFGRT